MKIETTKKQVPPTQVERPKKESCEACREADRELDAGLRRVRLWAAAIQNPGLEQLWDNDGLNELVDAVGYAIEKQVEVIETLPPFAECCDCQDKKWAPLMAAKS